MLPRTLKEIGFTAGLNTKGDERAQPEQLLGIGLNVEFDDIGGLRCRFPFDNVRTALVGGGTLTNARRIFMNGSELCCFTDTALYSWNAQMAGWVRRGTHLAVKMTEANPFATNGDQIDCDRAELGNAIVFAWTDSNAVYAAALDKTTGSVTMAPTLIAATGGRPRLVALSTRILFTFHTGTDSAADTLSAVAIDPANVVNSAIGVPTILIAAGTFNLHYDVARLGATDTAVIAARRITTTSYSLLSINAALATTVSVKARANDQSIAVASSNDGLSVQVVRGNSGNLQGDYVTVAGMVDVFTNQAIGTYGATLNQIAIASRSVKTSSVFRFYVFWSYAETVNATDWQSWSNWVSDANTLGVAAIFIRRLGVASRAFDYNGSVYVWMAFAGASTFSGANLSGFRAQLQNSYFCYRDDAFLVAQAGADKAGGFSASQSHLPGVALTSGSTTFSWCGGQRRIVSVSTKQTAYAKRMPLDIAMVFDSNEARRTARLGKTLYIAGGEILQYDGAQLTEVGAHIYPWSFGGVQSAGGAKADGTYAYKATVKWENAQGEIDRSTVATVGTVTLAGGPSGVTFAIVPLFVTHKTAKAPTIEVWASAVNPVAGVPFYLVSSQDPSVSANPNRYLSNDTTVSTIPSFIDWLADAAVTVLQNNPENGAVLPNLAPPAASIILSTDTRLFLAGLAGDLNSIWYSKQRSPGEVAAFNDALVFSVPADGGPISAIGFIDGVMVVWCATATYAYAGAGFDNTGGGSNFQLSRVLSTDLGCVAPEACVLFDDGYLVKTNKGWFLLDRSLNYTYIGEGIAKYDAESVLASTTLTARHQVRILTSGRMLVYDTLVKQWAETSVSDGLDMLLWNGTPAYLTATGVRAELATWAGYAGTDYTLTSMDIETGWVKFGEMQARAIVDFVQLLGQLDSTCVIRKRLAKDYEATAPGVWNYHTDVTWTPSPGTIGSALQVRQAPKHKRCESLKARFTVTAPDGVSPLGGPCVHLTSITIPFALEPNAYGAMAAAQKQ